MTAVCSSVKSLSAYNLIRELILKGELLPGTRLVLAELEEKLNVGRGPIREALMRLDRSGLIQNIPYKGAVVAPLPSYREMQYIYDLRVEVECTLALEAMRLMTDADYEELELFLKEEEPQSDTMLFFNFDREFHAAIYRKARMPHLQNMADSLIDHIEIFLNSRFYGTHDQHLLITQHRVIVEALRAKDAQSLREHLSRNIYIGLEMIQQERERLGIREKTS